VIDMRNSVICGSLVAVMVVASARGQAAAQPAELPAELPAEQPGVLTGDELSAAPPPLAPPLPVQPPRLDVPSGTGPSATPPLIKPLAPAGPGGVPAPAPVVPDDGVEPASRSDANAGNNFLMPTALMPPAGSFGFHDYELFIAGLSYAPSNRVMLSISTVIPFDELAIALASAKVQVYRSANVRLALHGTALFGSDGGSGDGIFAGSLGAVATACFDDACRSHASGFVAKALSSDEDDEAPILFAGGVVLALSDNVRLLSELDVGSFDDSQNDGKLFWYGLRFTSRHLSTDLGFVRPLVEDFDEDFPLGFPMVIFNYRS
jgi:hypothetical protein